MKRTALFLVVGATVMLFASAAMARQAKVDVCHVPPGNPANVQFISVGAASVPAHFAHGDQYPECLDTCRADITCVCTGIVPDSPISGCGNCGIGGDRGTVITNVCPEDALDVCKFMDGPCDHPDLEDCDGSRVFAHGWTCD